MLTAENTPRGGGSSSARDAWPLRLLTPLRLPSCAPSSLPRRCRRSAPPAETSRSNGHLTDPELSPDRVQQTNPQRSREKVMETDSERSQRTGGNDGPGRLTATAASGPAPAEDAGVGSDAVAAPSAGGTEKTDDPGSPEVVLRRRPGRAGRARSELGVVIDVSCGELVTSRAVDADGYVRYSLLAVASERSVAKRGAAPLAPPEDSPPPARPSLWGRLRRLGSPGLRHRHSCTARVTSLTPEALAAEFRRDLAACASEEAVEALVADYLRRFSELAGPLVSCAPSLGWFEADGRGPQRLLVSEGADINTPAVAAALVQKRYVAQAGDEINLEVGDMISVIDMAPPDESAWWRGKRGLEVGFFPCECVQLIGEEVPQQLTVAGRHRRAATLQPRPSMIRRQGKLTAFFRSFMQPRPSRRRLRQSGPFRDRVFGCDLSEHVLLSGRSVPVVLTSCAEFIETHGIVDGIYRLSGVNSNIKRLRNNFDEERVPDLLEPSVRQDIHSVSCLLKQYFRELPNPLLTYQLYDKFVAAVQSGDDQRLLRMRDVVQQLPPPHYRALEYLSRHLARVSQHGHSTGMTAKNLAIVWAPNLARSRQLEAGGVMALQGVGVQAVIVEYLIRYCELVFSDKLPAFHPQLAPPARTRRRSRPRSLAVCAPAKLVSLEESRARAPGSPAREGYLEVGGGPAALPTKYHTVLDSMSPRKTGSLRFGRSPIAWRSLFRGRSTKQRAGKDPTPMDIALKNKTLTESDLSRGRVSMHPLRSVRSAESLVPTAAQRDSEMLDSGDGTDGVNPARERSASEPDAATPADDSTADSVTPARAESHDSYFNATSAQEMYDKSEDQPDDIESNRPNEELLIIDLDEKGSLENEINAQLSLQKSRTVEAEPQHLGTRPHAELCRGTSLPPQSSMATSLGIAQLPTDSDPPPLAPHYRQPEETEVPESPDTERFTPGDDDATGLDLSEMGDEEAIPDESRVSGLVPEALEMLDQRLNSVIGTETFITVDTERAESRCSYENFSTYRNGEDLETTDATYEVFEFPALPPGAGEGLNCEGDSGAGTFEQGAYENTQFESTRYENSTFAGVADLPYENVGAQEYANVQQQQQDRDDQWVYEDIVPADPSVKTQEDCVYEPVCVTSSPSSDTATGANNPTVPLTSGDEVYAQVKEFRRTLQEVNSIVKLDRSSLDGVSDAAPAAMAGEKASEDKTSLGDLGNSEAAVTDDSVSLPNHSEHAEMASCSLSGQTDTLVGSNEEDRTSQAAQEVTTGMLNGPAEEQPNCLPSDAPETLVPGARDVVHVLGSETSGSDQVPLLSTPSDVVGRDQSREPAIKSGADVMRQSSECGSDVYLSAVNQAPETGSGTSAAVDVEGADDVSDSSTVCDTLSSFVAETEGANGQANGDITPLSEKVEPSSLKKTGSEDVAMANNCPKAVPAIAEDVQNVAADVVTIDAGEAAVDVIDGAAKNTTVPTYVDLSPDLIFEETSSVAVVSGRTEATSTNLVLDGEDSDGSTVENFSDNSTADTSSGTIDISGTLSDSVFAPGTIPYIEPSHRSAILPADACSSGNNTWPRRPLDSDSDRTATLPGASASSVSSARSPLSSYNAPASPAGPSKSESAAMRPETSWSRADMRRPCERRASFRQLLSRFEAFGRAELSPAEAASQHSARMAEHAVASVHGESPSRGYHPLGTRSLPRPAARRESAPDFAGSLATSLRGASPRPVRRHLSQQLFTAEDQRGGTTTTSTATTNPFRTARPADEDGSERTRQEDDRDAERPDGSADGTVRRHQSAISADRLSATTRDEDVAELQPPEATPGESGGLSSPAGQPEDEAPALESEPIDPVQSAAEARQRIERYKEERRHLLRERFRADAFLQNKSERHWQRRQRDAGLYRSPSPSPATVAPSTGDDVTPGDRTSQQAPAKSRLVRRADSLHTCPSGHAPAVSVVRSGSAGGAGSPPDPLDDVSVRDRVAGWSRGRGQRGAAAPGPRPAPDAAGNIRSIAARFEGPAVATARGDSPGA